MIDLKDIYEAIGYRCVEVSAKEKKNIETIKEIMIGKTSMFVGHSGVGKSTLFVLIRNFFGF